MNNIPLVISNTCAGAYFYKYKCNMKIPTVFAYSLIGKNSLLYLIQNFKSINFNNVKFEIVNKHIGIDSKNFVKATIDNKIEVFYIHYFDIESTKEKYFKRLQRQIELINNGCQIIFLIVSSNFKKQIDTAYFSANNINDCKIIEHLLAIPNVYMYSMNSEFLNNKINILNSKKVNQEYIAKVFFNKLNESGYKIPTNINLSILTPIYKVNPKKFQQYINQMVQLAKNISMTQFILVVDDDNDSETAKLAINFKESNPNINIEVYFNNGNKGIGFARNVCLEHASGEFIWFFDYDDNVYINNLKYLLDLAINKKDIDIFIGGFLKHFKNTRKCVIMGNYNLLKKYNEKVCINAKHIAQLLSAPGMARWIIKNSFIKNNNLKFDITISPGEDGDFLYRCVMIQKKIFIITKYIFRYTFNQDWNIKWKIERPLLGQDKWAATVKKFKSLKWEITNDK